MVQFPAPVGGTVMPDDFIPSILFAVLYASLAPFMLYRVFHRRSRCTLLIGTIVFSVERVVIFSLRAVQARNQSRRFSPGLITYLQISFGMGFIGIANDVVKLTRCLLVNATYGPETYPQSAAAATKGGLVPPPTADTPDQPRVRFWIRRASELLGLAFLAAIVPEIIANSHYSTVFSSQRDADMTARDRTVSTAVAVGLSCIVVCMALWGRLKLPRVCNRGVSIIGVIYALVLMIGIYRLSVMWIKTTSLSAPNPLNTPLAKAGFYAFHVLPEWLASLILFVNNTRKTFGTGLVGDFRHRDETEAERVKREARAAKRQAKKKNLVDTERIGMQEMKGQS